MHRQQVAPRHDHQMLVTSPRCSLNCNGLSMHLPPLSESYQSNYVSPPMSASYNQPKFDERNLYTNHHAVPNTHQAPSSKRSTTAAAVYANKAVSKDGRSELSTPSSTDTSIPSNPPSNTRTKNPADWGEELSSNPHDSSEAQLVPGPPGIARRAKAHVPSACVNCKKKHLACETKRPCTRCVHNGKEVSLAATLGALPSLSSFRPAALILFTSK